MATTEEQEQRAVLSTWVPLTLASELRALATREDRSLSAEIRRALHGHLALEDLRRDERRRP